MSVVCTLLGFLLLTHCADPVANLPDPEKAKERILTLMQEQQACWNRGDIVCFMESYWASDSLRFIGKSGLTYGWQQTLDNYKRSYPDQAAMGTLHFRVMRIEPLSEKYMHVIGQWQLDREEDTLQGHYTLLWEYKKGDWVITTDHSS